MHAQKIAKSSRSRANAMPLPMIDRSREEEILLRLWAASDSEKLVEELDLDDPLELDIEFAGVRPDGDRFDS